MQRCLAIALLVGFYCSLTTPVQAQWLRDFAHRVRVDFQRNNSWPDPFIQQDRDAVCMPFDTMARNGWRKQTLISDYHFEDDTNKLTAAGDLKVRWLLTQVPEHRRLIYVQRANTPEETAARVDAVQQAASRVVRNGHLPEVIETDLDPMGWPAEQIDIINKRSIETQPDPRLPASGGGDSGGESGS